MSDDIPFDRSIDVRPGVVAQISPMVRRLIANNGGPFTFTGTCSYLVGRREIVIIDPGPAEPAHRAALLQAAQGCTVRAILVTHSHRDHSLGAVELQRATGAPILGPAPASWRLGLSDLDSQAMDAAHDRTYAPDRVLNDGDTITAEDVRLEVLATPGHTANHLAYAFRAEEALFSGDHVMAWSTTVVAPPDGSMRDYLTSLDKLLGRTEGVYWPGHGGPVRQPPRFVRALIHHRRQREASILTRLQAGEGSVEGLVGSIYVGLAVALRGAAALTVRAHLDDLESRGMVARSGAGKDARYRPVIQGR